MALSCSRPECDRSAEWQPILYVPIVRAAQRDVMHLIVPLVFCDEHDLSRRMTVKVQSSARFHEALSHRIRDGWSPQTDKAWFERTRIVMDAS